MTHVRFNTSCQICGRRLLVRIEYLGAKMECPHCQGCFIARDPSTAVDERPPIEKKVNAELLCRTSASVR